jgi:naphthoate synthase
VLRILTDANRMIAYRYMIQHAKRIESQGSGLAPRTLTRDRWREVKNLTGSVSVSYETIIYEEDGPVGTITLNRPDDGNMFTETTCYEVRDCIELMRRETRTRVLVITGAGDKFFCIGGRKDGMEDTRTYAGVLPTLDMYEAIDRLQKPVIASVNGYAVGGGNVLQVVCDLTIAKESAVFRQVGPMMGSFDAGYGTWYLEDLVGKKKAKELWYMNPRLSAADALDIGMINKVVPDDKLVEETRAMALIIADRGPVALAAIKGAFNARHGGVGGLARVAHDLLLRQYLDSKESKELGASFRERRPPDPEQFGH